MRKRRPRERGHASLSIVGIGTSGSLDPGNACRWVFDRTDNEALASVVGWFAGVPLRILLVLVVAYVANRLVRRSIRRLAEGIAGSRELRRLSSASEANPRSVARAQTVSTVLRSACSGIIGIFAFVYILGVLGVNLGPLIAGAGVAGLAIGFGKITSLECIIISSGCISMAISEITNVHRSIFRSCSFELLDGILSEHRRVSQVG